MRPLNKYDGRCGQKKFVSISSKRNVNLMFVSNIRTNSVSLPAASQFDCKNSMGCIAHRIATGCGVNIHRSVIKFTKHEFIKA